MDEKPTEGDKPSELSVAEGLNESEEPLTFGRVALQFFVIPMLIVAFCVAIVFLFRWLTYEQRNVDEYLVMLRQGSSAEQGQAAQNLFDNLLTYIPEAKRWQGIFDVTQQLRADKEKFLREHPRFTEQVLQIFEESADPKVQRYLALTLGLIGGKEAADALVKALDEAQPETAIAILIALGNLEDESSLPRILRATNSDDAGIRQTAVYVLGSFESDQVIHPLEAALNDPNELVTWNAAFGLARHGSKAGEKVLTRLLDFEYVSKRGSLTVTQRQQYRVAAIQQLAQLNATNVVEQLETISAQDPDMPVRQAAIEALKTLRGPKG